MSKELEALRRMHRRAMKCQQNTSIQETSDYIKLEQSLTPPTADEVCKTLGEYFKHKEIKYENGCFYYQPMITKPKQYISIKRELAFSGKIVYTIEIQLPPHLITMIGKFYEEV